MPMSQLASSEFRGEGFREIQISRPASSSPYMRTSVFAKVIVMGSQLWRGLLLGLFSLRENVFQTWTTDIVV